MVAVVEAAEEEARTRRGEVDDGPEELVEAGEERLARVGLEDQEPEDQLQADPPRPPLLCPGS